MKFARHAEGVNMIPNIEFWASLPGLVKVCVIFAYKRLNYFRMVSSTSLLTLLAKLLDAVVTLLCHKKITIKTLF